jgi:hypothetical protein
MNAGGTITLMDETHGDDDNLTLGRERKICLPKMVLGAEKALLTVKHDRECGLDVNVAPESGFTVSGHRIEIRREGSAERHTLGESRTLEPWQSDAAVAVYTVASFHTQGHPEDAPARLYHSGTEQRRPTP